MSLTESGKNQRTLREEARLAKSRIKSGFWAECQEDMQEKKEKAKDKEKKEKKKDQSYCYLLLMLL